MADPRFYDNCGPITVAELCTRLAISSPDGIAREGPIADVAAVESACPSHLTYCAGKKASAKLLKSSRAGYCLLDNELDVDAPASMILLRCASAALIFAQAAELFYPEFASERWHRTRAVDPSAKIGEDVQLSPGVIIGPGTEIGDGTRIGPNAVIGRGVIIGRNCIVGSNVSIGYSYIGDDVVILPGAQLGQSGFGFASGPRGHLKIPQLGRVIVQDRVEIGACTTIDRGALGDTVIGEGTKVDNLVQVGHNCQIGRHCIIVGQAGLSGSCELGDFVVLGGQVGLADHVKIGDGARLAARSAMAPGELAGGQDYGGAPARPIREWKREMAAVARLSRQPTRVSNG